MYSGFTLHLVTDSDRRWASQRKVFGKPLHSQAVIRAKLAAMISRVESAQCWIENITYQMNLMNYKEQADKLAGWVLPASSNIPPYLLTIADKSLS